MFEQNTIYNPNGSALVVFDGESLDFNGIPTHEEEMMKSDFVAVSWNDTRKYTLPVGAYVVLDGVKYMLLDPYTPEQKNEESFTYSPQFQHPVMWLTKIPFIHVSGDTSSWETATKDTDWTYTGSASTIAARLVECINWLSTVDPAIGEVFDDGWTAVVSDDLAASATCNFSSLSIFGAASEMANKFDCEFHFDYAEKTFRFGTVSYGDSVTFKVGDNVQVASVSNTKEDYYNAFLVHGSTRNLSQPTESGNMQVFRRLDLDPTTYPDSILYTDNSGNVITREQFLALGIPQLTKELVFDDIYPRIDLYLYNPRERECWLLDEDGNRTEDEVNGKLDPADGKKYKYYSKWYIRLASPVKNELGEITGWEDYLVQDDQIISGETLSLVFQANEESHTYTSPLAGREFELVFFKQETREKEQDDINPDGFTAQPGDYRIVFTEEGELIIPTTSPMGLVPKGAATPSAENNIISLFNIAIGDDEMRVARERLLTAATKEKNRLRSDLNNYTFKSNPVAFEQNPPTLHLGQTAVYNDGQDLNGGTAYSYQSHIIKLVTNLDFPCEVEITVGNEKVKGTMATMKEQIETIITAGGGEGGGYTESQFSNLVKRFGSKFFLSKVVADFAQGVITFVKGLFVGDGTHGIDENGNATLNDTTLNSVQTPSYSGTDIVSDKGFKVWEDNEGKSHMMVDYFSARIKAFFASLEIRKIEHSAGNRIESPAGNTLALVKKFDASGQEVKDLWYARRYTFAGVSFGMPKLVYQVANYFGVWKEDPSATVAYYRCYWTADDKEAKKAVENNWKIGDQAYCETFNLRVPQDSGYASNKRYWRLVTGTGYETIEGTEYAYIDLTNIEDNVTVVDEQSQTYVCKHGYESGSGKPEAGDDVACFGNQIKPQERGGAIQYVTYDPNASQSGDGVPCVKMFSGIGGNADHPFDLSRYVIQKQSPTGVAIRADQFTIYSASGTGMSSTDPSSTLICDRGNYSSDTDYAYGDLVQYRGSSWLCIASSKITNIEPSDANSSYWKIYAQRGMGTPYIQLDCSNVIVSTNSEGRISSQSDIIVRPTRIEIYVDGNRVPVSAWSLPNSYVLYYNRVQYFTQSGLQPGINIGSFTASSNYVTINWQYYPIVNGQTIINPVIDSTSIAFHVVFTYKGETCEADTSIPLTVQRPGANGTNGAQGSNGLNSATVFLYQRASSTPAKPSSSLTYTFATGVLSGTLGNWSQTIPVNGNPCYVIQATAISSSATDTIASTEWSTPVVLVEDGEDGSAGYNTATIYLYQRYAATTQAPTPSLPSGTLTYTFATKALSGTLGNWQQSIPSGTNPLYVTAATAYSNTATDTIASNEWSTPVVMAKNGEDGQSVMAEYSATGASGTWHSAFQTGDIYVHYSYDGGSTWTTAIRFVGKSIEFEKGIRHFASYDDLMAYLVSIESAMTDKDMGYYIADTDDGGAPEATLWYFYTQSSDPRDIEYVPFPATGELNYFTSYDGHLWNADNTSESWTDMGAIQGADGRGISSITEKYLATPLSSGVTTSTSGWTTSVQTLTNTNKYLWNYETIAYTDGSSTNTTPAIIGVYGDKGADGTNGRGITSVTNYYLATSASSGVTRSTSGWTTGYQQVTSVNKYLWNYEDILYTDGQHAYTDPHIIGTYGVDGVDGISITLDPAAVIFNQAETSPYGIDTSGFAATVRVWQGANPLSGTFFTNNDITATNCVAAKHATLPNTIIITSINTWTDSENVTHYYSSGKVEVSVSVNGSSSVTLTLNWAANLLGDWKLSVKNDTMEAVSSMTVAVYDEDGQLTTSQLSSAITQNSLGVSLSAKKDDVETAGLHLDGQNSSINLVAGKVNFIDPNGGSNTKISIDTETGTLHATDGVFEGTLNAKSYLTQFADLETYCYNRPRSGNPNDKGFIPGYHKTMYNAQNESINIEGTWCFRVGASDMPVCLPTNIDGLVGQRVLLYNPHIAYLSFGTNATIINACAIDGDGYDIIYGTEEVIRGIGNPVRSTRDPVLIDYYEPVYEIIFADGVVELQCMPSDVAGSYEWSVVNLGTNVNKLIS